MVMELLYMFNEDHSMGNSVSTAGPVSIALLDTHTHAKAKHAQNNKLIPFCHYQDDFQ